MSQPSSVPSLSSGSAAASQIYQGPNFSGRSKRLRARTQAVDERGFFIAPDVTSTFSGFASTVNAELEYFSESKRTKDQATIFLDSLGMKAILSRNPLTLSGGEQAVAALAMAIGSGAEVVAADCCFEQLDIVLRAVVIQRFQSCCSAGLVFADNRADEHLLPEGVESIELPPTIETAAAALDRTFLLEGRSDSATIEFQDVRAHYRSKDSFTLSVPSLVLQPGTVYQLVGPNGAGKTTLCRVLAGLLPMAGGHVLRNGKETNPWRHPGRVASLSFQNPDHQLFANTLESELLSRGLCATGLDSMLKSFGIAAPRHSHPGSLPFVLRKRLSLAATFSTPRGWYILDEPTIGQDIDSIAALALIIRRLAVSGCGIIVVSHSKRFTQMLDAHQIVVKGGVCVGDEILRDKFSSSSTTDLEGCAEFGAG